MLSQEQKVLIQMTVNDLRQYRQMPEMERYKMNASQQVEVISGMVSNLQLPQLEYTVKRYRKWFRYYYSIESEYCKVDGYTSFQDAMNALMSGGIRVMDINVDGSCYD